MYTVPVEVRQSTIDGKGVFAKEGIKKGTIVWQYTHGHDKRITKEAFEQLDTPAKIALQRIAYLSPTTDMWVIPPDNDPACYTNHNPTTYNTKTIVNKSISDEPIFIATRHITAGEEITNNYKEFDKNSTSDKFVWLESPPTKGKNAVRQQK